MKKAFLPKPLLNQIYVNVQHICLNQTDRIRDLCCSFFWLWNSRIVVWLSSYLNFITIYKAVGIIAYLSVFRNFTLLIIIMTRWTLLTLFIFGKTTILAILYEFVWCEMYKSDFYTAIFHIWQSNNCPLFHMHGVPVPLQAESLLYKGLFFCFTDWLVIITQWQDSWLRALIGLLFYSCTESKLSIVRTPGIKTCMPY